MATELVEFTAEDKKVIMNTYFPQGTSNEEMTFCMSVAKHLGLNPILKEIYFVERQSNVDGKWVKKIEPLAGRDAFLKLAHRSGQFAGLETSSKIVKVPRQNDGKWELVEDLVATCRVFRKDCERPFVTSVIYSEYVQTKKDGTPTKFWKEKATTMLQKVAESQCLRKAFNISGVYAEEEMENISEKHEPKKEPKKVDLNSIPKHDKESGEVIEEIVI